MYERIKALYRAHFAQPELIRFWGREYAIQPAVLNQELGDGNKIIYFTPLNTRPWYYVVFIDSSWDFDTWEFKATHLEKIYEAIEDEFGRMCGEDFDACKTEGGGESCGRHDEDDAWFPVLSDDCGSCWGECVNLAYGNGISELQYLRRTTRRPAVTV